MSGSVRLEFLGSARVLRDDVPASGLGKKALALVAYLATQPDRHHSREQLATLLWGDRFEEQARQSLRQTLTSVRKAMGDVVVTDEGGVSLPANTFVCDAADFGALAAAQDPDSIRRACDIYRGDFVESLINVSPDFDDWASMERTRLRNKFLDALESLSRADLASGQLEQALASAQRLLSHDPANEAGCRVAMTALARLGRRPAALRQFEACKTALARTLDATPSQETLDLVSQIQHMPAAEAVDLSREPGSTSASQPAPPVGSRKLTPGVVFGLVAAGFAGLVTIGYLATRVIGASDGDSASACAAAIGLPGPAAPALAVLPMQNIGGDPAEQNFTAATTARIIDILGDTPALVIKQVPRGRDFAQATPQEIAAQLGVTHLLEGTAHVEGGRIQVSLRLIDGATGAVLQSHAHAYDFTPATRRRSQDAIAIAAAEAVQVQLTEGEQALNYYTYPTMSMEVFEHLTRASQHLDQMSRSHNARAREEYSAAHTLDARDPRATSGLGWTYMIDAMFGWSADPATDLARAQDLAEESIASEPNFFYPYSLLALVSLMEGDHETALARAEEAVRISGSGADATAVLALVLTYVGDPTRSAEMARAAMRRRPLTYPPWYEWILGRAARLNGETDLALACMPAERVRDSGFLLPMIERATALADSGDLEGARREMAATAGQFDDVSAQTYCAHPPYATEALTQRCIADARRAGAR